MVQKQTFSNFYKVNRVSYPLIYARHRSDRLNKYLVSLGTEMFEVADLLFCKVVLKTDHIKNIDKVTVSFHLYGLHPFFLSAMHKLPNSNVTKLILLSPFC